MASLSSKKKLLWLVAGIFIGMWGVCAFLKPLFAIKVFVFVVGISFYGVVAFLFCMWLFNRFVRPFDLDDDTEPWSRKQEVLLVCMLLMVLAISISMGVWLAQEVRPDNNPWREEVDQTYPY